VVRDANVLSGREAGLAEGRGAGPSHLLIVVLVVILRWQLAEDILLVRWWRVD
jgi:hypothetical protein